MIFQIGLVLALLVALLLAGQGGLARSLYPPLLAGLAILVFKRRREWYMDLVLWCLFLSPFLRRVMDFQADWKDPSLVLLTPYLVCLVAPVLGWRRLASAALLQSGPFLAALFAIAYGLLIGITESPFSAVASSAVNWAVPVLFAWWFSTLAPDELQTSLRSLERSFFWGTLGMGLYAAVQFVVAPAWDTNWLVQLGSIADVTSMGAPEPYGLRVFSTMNSAGVYALVSVFGILLLVESKRKFAPLGVCSGLCGLLLTVGRSAWMALAFGLLLLTFKAPQRVLRTLAIPVVALVLFSPMLAIGPMQTTISDRLQSFTHPTEDASSADRVQGAGAAIYLVENRLGGFGLGLNDNLIANDGSFSLHDNGIVEAFLTLGVPGALLYLGAFAMLLLGGLRSRTATAPLFTLPFVITLAISSQVLLSSAYLGTLGIFLWLFTAWASRERALGTAARDAPKTASDGLHETITSTASAANGFAVSA